MSTHTDTAGAAFFVSNAFGWATAKTPWEAFSKLTLTADKEPKPGSGRWIQATEAVSLYYLPDESKFVGTNYYAPVDSQGHPYGVPLYAGEFNADSIKEILSSAKV